MYSFRSSKIEGRYTTVSVSLCAVCFFVLETLEKRLKCESHVENIYDGVALDVSSRAAGTAASLTLYSF